MVKTVRMNQVIATFCEQNRRLRMQLNELAPSGVVNAAAFDALDRFDRELSGDGGVRNGQHGVFIQCGAVISGSLL